MFLFQCFMVFLFELENVQFYVQLLNIMKVYGYFLELLNVPQILKKNKQKHNFISFTLDYDK